MPIEPFLFPITITARNPIFLPPARVCETLAKSKSLWERRISVLACFAFIREGDFKETLKIARILLRDKHDLIHKAVGWMLREMGKKEEKVLEKFLQKYAGVMPRTMLRYSIERLPEKQRKSNELSSVPQRPAQLCPGCGHRSALHAIKKALKGTEITVADIGCHSLSYLPPYNVGEILMCMGASTGIGSGLSLYNESRKVLALLGDSTFFHAGLPGILNALFNKHNVTLILMENGTTAMTGHQDHPASGKNFNEVVDKIPVRKVLEGFGVKYIYEIDTYNQSELTKLVKQAL